MEDEDFWLCPKCGSKVSGFTGPATRALAISNHDYYAHERPARLREHWQEPQQIRLAFIDDSFYKGRQLSDDDVRMLHNCGACWNLPLDNDQSNA